MILLPGTLRSLPDDRANAVSTRLALYVLGEVKTPLFDSVRDPAALALPADSDSLSLVLSAFDSTATTLYDRAFDLAEDDLHESKARRYAGYVQSAAHMVEGVAQAAITLQPHGHLMPEPVRHLLLAALTWACAHRARFTTNSPAVGETVTDATTRFTQALREAEQERRDA